MAPNQSPQPFPLYETKFRNNKTSRAIEVIILGLLTSLITYRFHFLNSHGCYLPWILALLCESWFTFIWVLNINSKWNQLETITYPERLLQRLEDGTVELPAVDMFVTTADSELEPPILTVNTVLSLLAVDYPTKKLTCYVSDDGASPVTLYSLVEASKFAKSWVPFCKKFNVAVRAPFQHFNGNPTCPLHGSLEFQQEWEKMKEEYSILCGKIEDASEKTIFDFTGEFLAFAKIERRDHSPIIKVIWENKEAHNVHDEDGVPSIIYISREKRPKHPHHYKAGAMNVLTRVSGVMTNAPFMVNVDCDCYANDPKVALRAMCLLLGAEDETDAGFVQFPQKFYAALKDDPYGNQLKILMKLMGAGISGIQGAFYQGTGCFHRRKVVYGSSPNHTHVNEKSDRKEEIRARFGKSKAFVSSAAQTLSLGSLLNSNLEETSLFSSSLLESATQVANSDYEFGTGWGHEVGWIYGSATEDVLTGLTIHSRGWKSAYCDTNPPAFLGCAPTGGPEALIQQKRWAGGLMEILTSKHNPIISTAFRRLKFRHCLGYLWILLWPVRPIFEIVYSLLPAYCIISNSSFQPKVNEAAIIAPASIFIVYNLHTLWEYITCGESTRSWWNNQRMLKINASGAWLFGFLSGVFKVLGFSDTMFEVTKKDFSGDDSLEREKFDAGRFTFDDSPLFIPGTTILLVNVAALFIGFLDFKNRVWGLGEVICSIWVVLMYWAFLKGLFGKGKYGIPFSTILKSGALALIFVHASKFPY